MQEPGLLDGQLREGDGQLDAAAAGEAVPAAWGAGQPCSWWPGAAALGGNQAGSIGISAPTGIS